MDFSGRFADRIMPDKIHKISLSFLVDTLSKQFGGTAGNIAYTLNLLGIKPILFSTAGNDFGPYGEHLAKQAIDHSYIKIHKDVVTGSYFVVTDKSDNQIGAFHTGALKYNYELSLKTIKEPSDFVVIAPTTPNAMKKFVLECKQLGKPYLYDPAFQTDQFSGTELFEGIKHAAVFIGNDYEIDLALKKLKITLTRLRELVPIVVMTLGEKGSYVYTKNEKVEIAPVKPKSVVDPTGAGDAYRSGFLAGYLRGFDLTTCGQMGSVAAVYSVEKYGTQTHMFTKKEYMQKYQDTYDSLLKL